MGFDLNRHWANPSPWAHPTLHGVKELIIDMYNNPVSGTELLSTPCAEGPTLPAGEQGAAVPAAPGSISSGESECDGVQLRLTMK